jgi:transcriptional regulator with XRE-family HTH domain
MKMIPVKRSTPIDNRPIDLKMNFKSQLRYFLDQREMSASQLAKKAKVPKQSLSGWLSGSSPRDVRQVKRVADALGVTIDHLLFGNGTDLGKQRVTELEALLGEGWIAGLFEVRFRRIRR